MATTLSLYTLADIHSPDAFVMHEIDAEHFDAVVTLGDIDQGTLDYILHMGKRVHRFGVPGNHDVANPAGLNNLHLKVINIKGIRIGGFGGARKYKNHPHHYTENQVNRLMRQMPPVDLFISHAPPLAVSQNQDPIHQGFAAFDTYIEKYRPQYWLHGHLSRRSRKVVGDTTVIGVNLREPLHLEFTEARVPDEQRASSQSTRFIRTLQTALSNLFL